MVHTCEIYLDLKTFEEACSVLANFFTKYYRDINTAYDYAFSYLEESFNGTNNNGSITLVTSYTYPNSGIHEISIVWYRFNNSDIRYYLIIRMEPQVMITHYRTIDLFTITPRNLNILRIAFHEVMSAVFDDPSSYLTDIDCYLCRRIDYAINLNFSTGYDTFDKDIHATNEIGNAVSKKFYFNETPKYRTGFNRDLNDAAEIFFCFTGATSSYCRRRKLTMWRQSNIPNIDVEHIPDREQSTAEGNKSCKVHFYCKSDEIRSIYADYDMDCSRLINESRNIIRFELQCYPNKVRSLQTSWGLATRRFMNYLQPQQIYSLLINNYRQTIGLEDFYSFYHAKKIINDSNCRAATKEKLIHVLQLISQARHISIARNQFIMGTRIKNTNITVGGENNDTAETFNRYLRKIRNLGINPFLIPKDWYITRYRNPVYKIHEVFGGI